MHGTVSLRVRVRRVPRRQTRLNANSFHQKKNGQCLRAVSRGLISKLNARGAVEERDTHISSGHVRRHARWSARRYGAPQQTNSQEQLPREEAKQTHSMAQTIDAPQRTSGRTRNGARRQRRDCSRASACRADAWCAHAIATIQCTNRHVFVPLLCSAATRAPAKPNEMIRRRAGSAAQSSEASRHKSRRAEISSCLAQSFVNPSPPHWQTMPPSLMTSARIAQ